MAQVLVVRVSLQNSGFDSTAACWLLLRRHAQETLPRAGYCCAGSRRKHRRVLATAEPAHAENTASCWLLLRRHTQETLPRAGYCCAGTRRKHQVVPSACFFTKTNMAHRCRHQMKCMEWEHLRPFHSLCTLPKKDNDSVVIYLSSKIFKIKRLTFAAACI